jgi:single-stranded-DNA-specific exonuclease
VVGQTSTSLLVGVLKKLDADIVYHIPVRAAESHGVNLPGLKDFLGKGIDLVITCDTGITAFDAASYLKHQSIDYIVTDHHSLGERLPDALAVINPQRLPADHPFRGLAGVGVAYEVVKALCELEGKSDLAQAQLDLVALGCIADVAPLTGDVRYLVQLGMDLLREPQRIGLRALYDRAELISSRLTEQHVGFVIGPRLNAVGRLSDANPMVEFLTTEDPVLAAEIAARLEGLNSERRFMTEQVFKGAISMLERDPASLEWPVLILDHPDWPAGVIGIVASRLVDLFGKPVILLSSPPGEPARGSARSIDGVNITRAISASADLLLGFGGHPMAAGLAVDPGNLPRFRAQTIKAVQQQTKGLELAKQLNIDAAVSFDELTLETVSQLERMAPFGAGNPPILLAAANVKAVEISSIGRSGEHLQILVQDEKGSLRRVLWWQGIRELVPEGVFDLAFTARTSDYRGAVDVQLEWVDARSGTGNVEVEKPGVQTIEVLDYRHSPDPLHDLLEIRKMQEQVIWREGSNEGEPKGFSREHLTPADTLVIWNPPPGRKELDQALAQVQPSTVALLGVTAVSDDPRDFLSRLGGLIRHAIRTRAGELSIARFAGILNQRETLVNLGIRWLIARGSIRVVETQEDHLIVAENGVPDLPAANEIEKDIRRLLQETAAFRAFYLRANPASFFEVSYKKG